MWCPLREAVRMAWYLGTINSSAVYWKVWEGENEEFEMPVTCPWAQHVNQAVRNVCRAAWRIQVCQPSQVRGVEGRGLGEVVRHREGRALGTLPGLEEELAKKPTEESASRRRKGTLGCAEGCWDSRKIRWARRVCCTDVLVAWWSRCPRR